MNIKAPIVIFNAKEREVHPSDKEIAVVDRDLNGYDIPTDCIKAVYTAAGKAVFIKDEFKGKVAPLKAKGIQAFFDDTVTFAGEVKGKKLLLFLTKTAEGIPYDLTYLTNCVLEVRDSGGIKVWPK